MPSSKNDIAENPIYILKDSNLWLSLVSTILTLAAMFSSYSYLAAYLEKVSQMKGIQVSIMLLLFGGMGILGNWLMGIALSKNVILASRSFFILLIGILLLAYYFGGMFSPMVIIVALWGMIHTGGFLVPNIRTTQNMPHHVLEFVNSLLTSCYNIGISLGAMLGGMVIKRYGVHEIIWMTIPLLLLVYALSFVKTLDSKNTAEENSDILSKQETVRCLSNY